MTEKAEADEAKIHISNENMNFDISVKEIEANAWAVKDLINTVSDYDILVTDERTEPIKKPSPNRNID